MLIKALLKKDKKLAKRVADFFGNRTDHRIVITPQKEKVNDQESQDMARIIQLEKDPVQRIAENNQAIDDSLAEIIKSFEKQGLDARLLEQQRQKISKEILRTQNLIRSLLQEK